MKKCIIIHGCPSDIDEEKNQETSTYNKHWIPWIKNKLIGEGIDVLTPIMPFAWNPDYENFKQEFEKHTVDKDSILIGHSCGGAFLVRWLGESKKRVSKLILVAPRKTADNEKIFREKFYGYKIDNTLKDRVGEIIMFTSDNEEVKGKESLEIFHNTIGGKIIEIKGNGHYTIGDMGTEKFPELLTEILN